MGSPGTTDPVAAASILLLQGAPGPLEPTCVAHIDSFLPFNKHLMNTYYVLMLAVRCAKRTILILKELIG